MVIYAHNYDIDVTCYFHALGFVGVHEEPFGLGIPQSSTSRGLKKMACGKPWSLQEGRRVHGELISLDMIST